MEEILNTTIFCLDNGEHLDAEYSMKNALHPRNWDSLPFDLRIQVGCHIRLAYILIKEMKFREFDNVVEHAIATLEKYRKALNPQ